MQFSINILFLVELLFSIYIDGVNQYSKRFRVWPETVAQLINIFSTYQLVNTYQNVQFSMSLNSLIKTYELIIFIRILKLLTLVYEIRAMRLIIETMRNMVTPLLYFLGVLFIIFYVFALIGMVLFGGKITRTSQTIMNNASVPNNYYLSNFNDLASSFVTLFSLMVVNNWMVTVQMYIDTMENDNNYLIFFVAFYYFSVIVGINILVAFTLDMYSSVERLDEERMKTLEMLEKELKAPTVAY